MEFPLMLETEFVPMVFESEVERYLYGRSFEKVNFFHYYTHLLYLRDVVIEQSAFEENVAEFWRKLQLETAEFDEEEDRYEYEEEEEDDYEEGYDDDEEEEGYDDENDEECEGEEEE